MAWLGYNAQVITITVGDQMSGEIAAVVTSAMQVAGRETRRGCCGCRRRDGCRISLYETHQNRLKRETQ